jgi:hypothetical protein
MPNDRSHIVFPEIGLTCGFHSKTFYIDSFACSNNFLYLSQLDQKTSHVVLEICMWFPKQHDSLSKPQNLFSTFTMCGFKTTCWVLCGVETTRVCAFEICLFLLDRTARIDTKKVSTCRGSFGGLETTCFQLDRAASFKTTEISYFSCDRSACRTNCMQDNIAISL